MVFQLTKNKMIPISLNMLLQPVKIYFIMATKIESEGHKKQITVRQQIKVK